MRMNNFQLNHIASLCKYTGISFIAGAITHGFFSGERSFWTATFGIAIYLISGILEKIANPEKNYTWTNLLAIGIIASIGLGFFTGGLQHFPDSPARSSWVVPIGFAMSLLAMYLIEGKGVVKLKSVLTYGAASLTVVTVLSVMTLFFILMNMARMLMDIVMGRVMHKIMASTMKPRIQLLLKMKPPFEKFVLWSTIKCVLLPLIGMSMLAKPS